MTDAPPEQAWFAKAIPATPAHRSRLLIRVLFRLAALALPLGLILTAAACDAPDETPLTQSPAATTAPAQTPILATPTAEIEVHRDSFARPPVQATALSPDRAVLVTLYNATDGANWTNNTNWLSDAPLDTWHGVTTDSGGRVIELRLVDNRLRGAIPSELSRLSNLRTLWLAGNQIVGAIPPELGRLSQLNYLGLDDNQLTGRIPPELGNLSNLTSLGLGINELSGEIPPEFGLLANLRELYLPANRLSGAIPPELGNLTNLESLILAENQLEGGIPPELGRLANLTSLWLNDNHLQGEIPSALANLSNLDMLLLSGSNHLTGCIPEKLGIARLSDFAALRLPYCDLNGRVPPPAGPTPTKAPTTVLAADRAALVALYRATDGPNWAISTKWLSDAPIGEWHGVVTDPAGRVVELRLPNNRLAGVIPPELGTLEHLKLLALSRNQLKGAIPADIGTLGNLAVLSLNGNDLSGAIPPELGNLSFLRWMDLNTNRLEGNIPSELGRLVKLEALDLSLNQLSGEIPPALGRLSLLELLKLDENSLRGEIPAALAGLSRLHLLTLGMSNDFNGCVPEPLRSVAHSDIPELGLPFCPAT